MTEITPIQVRYKAEEFTETDLAEAIESVAFLDEPIFEEGQLPLQQQVVDKLADMLFASDMVLDMLRDELDDPASPRQYPSTGIGPCDRFDTSIEVCSARLRNDA